MRPVITEVVSGSPPGTWHVKYIFADRAMAMTVLAGDATDARRKAAEDLARYNVR
jgi:hypothetical protein